MMKIVVVLLVFVALAHADDASTCPDNVKTSFADAQKICKGKTTTPDDEQKCMSGEIRGRSEFKSFVEKCPDATVKGCLKGEVLKVCPGLF